MHANRYAWVCVRRDGTTVQRWNEDGTENSPDAYCQEFHLLPVPGSGLRPFSLFLRPEQRLVYVKRRHSDATNGGPMVPVHDEQTYLVGYEEDMGCGHFATYAQLLPDGRVEWSSNYNHITRHERNLDEQPLAFYEEWPV